MVAQSTRGISTLSSLHSFPISPLPSSPSHIQKIIQNAELVITKWDLNSPSDSLFDNPVEAQHFLKCVKDLRRTMKFLLSENSASNKLLIHSHKLMPIAMKRLQKELSFMFSSHPPESISSRSNSSSDFEDDNDETKHNNNNISHLKEIAECMISAGYTSECVETYKLARKSVVNKRLYQLGVERIRSSQIQKLNSEVLKNLISNWKNAANIAVKTVFSTEKSLCDHIFPSSQIIRESCFVEVIKESAMNLFRFPQSVSKTKKSPERIFPLMEIYETLASLWPEIEVIFSSESTSSIQLQALSSLRRLGESIRAILSEFESRIQKDSTKTSVIGGGSHPLTQTAMNYISSLADYTPVLSEIVPDSSVSEYLAWLILVLLCKLDRKAKAYKDVAFSYLFLANNLQFIVQKVNETRLKSTLGEDWVSEHSRKVKSYAAGYELMAWNRVFSCLPDKSLLAELSGETVKECLERFNAAFEEAYKKHETWIVEDRKLRDEMKVSIARKLVPVYVDFYCSCLRIVSAEMNSGMLVRYSPDDLENYLSDLFYGTEMSDLSSSSTSPSSSVRGNCIPR